MKHKSNRKIIVAGKDVSPAMLTNAVWALMRHHDPNGVFAGG